MNEMVESIEFAALHSTKLWSERCVQQYRNLYPRSPESLRQAVTAALIAGWSALLVHATFTALAAKTCYVRTHPPTTTWRFPTTT